LRHVYTLCATVCARELAVNLQPRVDIPVHDNIPLIYRSLTVRPSASRFVLAGITLALTTLLFVSAVRAQQLNPDLDGDGVIDVLDLDQDNDGIINSLEGVHRLESLSGLDAVYFAALPSEEISRDSSRSYDLINTENGGSAVLTGRVLSTDTGVEWTMNDVLPKLRNLGSGSTTVQWSVVGEREFENIDLTISDLDGTRLETITVSASSVAGYSLSLNTNVVVNSSDGQFSFTGTGIGGDSADDLVTLHFRNSSLMVVSYQNGVQTSAGNSSGVAAGSEIDVAGYRHSLDRTSSVFYTPVNQFRDTDGDGVSDHRDLDSDNDGLGDVVEAGGIDADNDNLIDGPVNQQGVAASVDPGLDSDAVSAVYFAVNSVSGNDFDGDGLLSSVDGALSEFGGSLAGIDSDSDGLSDLDEVRVFQTNPDEPDSDGDGLNDQSEVQLFSTDPLQADTDGDGISDGDEANVHNTNPISVDSDSDGTSDGDEIERGTDPLQEQTAILGEPQEVLERETVVGSEEGATPVLQSSESVTDTATSEDVDVAQSDSDAQADTDTELFDDPVQGDTVLLRTGLGGSAGCSIVASGKPEPLILLMLLMAIGCLTRNVKKNRQSASSMRMARREPANIYNHE